MEHLVNSVQLILTMLERKLGLTAHFVLVLIDI